jgi:hypothetical protein
MLAEHFQEVNGDFFEVGKVLEKGFLQRAYSDDVNEAFRRCE